MRGPYGAGQERRVSVEARGRTSLQGVDALLAAARAGIHRPGPAELLAVMGRGALVIDTRTG